MNDEPNSELSPAEKAALEALRTREVSRPSRDLEDRTVVTMRSEGLLQEERHVGRQWMRIAAIAAMFIVVFTVGINVGRHGMRQIDDELPATMEARPRDALEKRQATGDGPVGELERRAPGTAADEGLAGGTATEPVPVQQPAAGEPDNAAPQLQAPYGRDAKGFADATLDEDDLVADTFEPSMYTPDEVTPIQQRRATPSEVKEAMLSHEAARAGKNDAAAGGVAEEESAKKLETASAAPAPTMPAQDAAPRQYMLLVYRGEDTAGRGETVDPSERAEMLARWELALRNAGRLVESRQLGAATATAEPAKENVRTMSTARKSAETEGRRILTAYYVVTATSLQEARNLANGSPFPRLGLEVEIRPVDDTGAAAGDE